MEAAALGRSPVAESRLAVRPVWLRRRPTRAFRPVAISSRVTRPATLTHIMARSINMTGSTKLTATPTTGFYFFFQQLQLFVLVKLPVSP